MNTFNIVSLFNIRVASILISEIIEEKKNQSHKYKNVEHTIILNIL